MCTHIYKPINEFCDFEQSFDSNLPVHPDSGDCIFYSTDLEWKRNHKCTEWFIQLIGNLDRKGEIELYDLIIVGDSIDNTDMQVDFEGATHASIIYHAIIENGLALYDCEFHDDVYLYHLVFDGIIGINSCTFHKGLVLDHVYCKEDANLENGCSVAREFTIIDSQFIEQLSVNNNTFEGEVSIADSYFELPLHMMGNVFTATKLHVTFSSTFMSGVAFDRNTHSGLLSFDDSILHGKISIEANNGTPWVNLFRVELYGTFRFEGRPDNLLFQTAAEIRLDDITIHPGALLLFDHCNMLNINREFLIKLQELEKEAKVAILDTCKLYRFHEVVEYQIGKETDDLFFDFHQLVARYFATKYLTPLIVTMQRVDDTLMKVYYASIKEIEDFVAKQNAILKSIDDTTAPTTELEIQRRSALFRVRNLIDQGLLSEKDQYALRSNGGQVNVQELKVVIENFKIPQGATLLISEASIQSMQVNKLYIDSLAELKDPLKFELSAAQFDQLKAQILGIGDLSTIATNVKKVLTNQQTAIEKEHSIKEFLLSHGVSVVGSMTGATLFTFLRMAFPF